MKEPQIWSRDLRDNCPNPTDFTAAPKALLVKAALGGEFRTSLPQYAGIYRAIAAAIARGL